MDILINLFVSILANVIGACINRLIDGHSKGR